MIILLSYEPFEKMQGLEFSVDYETAKEYANRRRGKVARVHWACPATIQVYTCL